MYIINIYFLSLELFSDFLRNRTLINCLKGHNIQDRFLRYALFMSAGEDITEEAVQTEGHPLPKMDASTQGSQPNYFSVHSISFDDERIQFYTGLESFSRFMFVFQSLGQAVDQLNYYYGRSQTSQLLISFSVL